MENDLVSIITPSYNSADFIEETIDAIIAQTYTNWELLITDDCSTDNSVEIIERYAQKDPRIKLFKLDKNSGAGVCRNRSIKEAKGRFIAFCDSDDCWFAQKLELQIPFMKRKNCALSYASYIECSEDGDMADIIVCKKKQTLSSMKKVDGMGFLTVVFDTEKVGKVYLPTIRKRQDWGWKLIVLQKCKDAYGIKLPLAQYRLRNDSISRKKRSLVKYNVNIYRQVFGYSRIRAVLYFLIFFMPHYAAKKLFQWYINR